MVILTPYEVRTLTQRTPWANYLLIGANVVFFLLLVSGRLSHWVIYQMVLMSWYPGELIGHQFLHAGWEHLIFNMIFLWVFGNAVAGVMNNFLYLAMYLLLGVCAAAVHLLVNGGSMVGASGAISGIMGVYVAAYPLNRIHCFYLFLIRWGTFDAPGWILIALWFLLNQASALLAGGSGGIAYSAHLGGFVAGFGAGLLLLSRGLIAIEYYDNPTVLHLIARRSR